jgi:hypothetical protein
MSPWTIFTMRPAKVSRRLAWRERKHRDVEDGSKQVGSFI